MSGVISRPNDGGDGPSEAKRRAQEVGARPDVRQWVEKLRELARTMPPDVAVFCETGRPYVLALREARDAQGSRFFETPNETIDQDAIVASIARGPRGGGWDGGGW